MKSLMNISLAAALVASSIVVAAPDAMARSRHHQSQDICLDDRDIGGQHAYAVKMWKSGCHDIFYKAINDASLKDITTNR